MEMIIENATCYELKSGAAIERQEHCDIWWGDFEHFITGIAIVIGNRLVFSPFENNVYKFSDEIVRYSYDYGKTWEDLH